MSVFFYLAKTLIKFIIQPEFSFVYINGFILYRIVGLKEESTGNNPICFIQSGYL